MYKFENAKNVISGSENRDGGRTVQGGDGRSKRMLAPHLEIAFDAIEGVIGLFIAELRDNLGGDLFDY